MANMSEPEVRCDYCEEQLPEADARVSAYPGYDNERVQVYLCPDCTGFPR